MGIDWETWFAIRELYCNALDEGEAKIGISQTLKGEDGKTKIYVELNEELGNFFKDIKRFLKKKAKQTTQDKGAKAMNNSSKKSLISFMSPPLS